MGEKILFISGLQVFPAASGGQLRSSGLAAALARRGHTVTLYSLVGRKADYLAGRPSEALPVGPGITEHVDRTRWWAVVQLLVYRLKLPQLWIPLFLRVYRPPLLRQLLGGATRIIVDFPFLYPAARGADQPVALSTHNIEADLCVRPILRGLVRLVETWAARAADVVVCCSQRDLAHFAGVTGAGRTLYVPNGIDTHRFGGAAAHRDRVRAELGVAAATRVMLFAASAFGPNEEGLEFLRTFAREHGELLRRLGLHLLVVGSVAKQPEAAPGLTVTGPVAAVEPYFAAADMAINAVFRGSGTSVKMFEYLAAGLPIFTTEAGRRGLMLTDGEDCVVFTPQGLAAVLADAAILRDPAAAKRMAASARDKNRAELSMDDGIEPLAAWLVSPT